MSFVVVVPPQRLQLVIPTKIAIIEEKASARWTIGGGKGFSLYGIPAEVVFVARFL